MKQDGVSKEDIVTMLENPESLLVKPVEEDVVSANKEVEGSCCVVS
jgi:hypothetical protein